MKMYYLYITETTNLLLGNEMNYSLAQVWTSHDQYNNIDAAERFPSDERLFT